MERKQIKSGIEQCISYTPSLSPEHGHAEFPSSALIDEIAFCNGPRGSHAQIIFVTHATCRCGPRFAMALGRIVNHYIMSTYAWLY